MTTDQVTLQKEEKKEEKPKSPKVGRRLSARVGDFFKSKPKEPSVPPKVTEAEDAPPQDRGADPRRSPGEPCR